MIELFFWASPNAYKVRLLLEEAAIPYRITPVNVRRGDQFAPDFLRISPNNRIPAILDHAPAGGGPSVSLFESGAILIYLAEKAGCFLPTDIRGRADVLQWLMWQMAGLGPMAGQNGHFGIYASEKIPYAIERYTLETARLYGVLNWHLRERLYIAADYSIADMACYPWILLHDMHMQRLEDFPNLERWFRRIAERPATDAAYAPVDTVIANPGILSDAERALLFRQTARDVAERAAAATWRVSD
jgi:GST-like protein